MSDNRSASHGRGGAGNISNKPSKQVDDEDLRTPVLKQQHYTTGRGGTCDPTGFPTREP